VVEHPDEKYAVGHSPRIGHDNPPSPGTKWHKLAKPLIIFRKESFCNKPFYCLPNMLAMASLYCL
jgi:hypothetical protein